MEREKTKQIKFNNIELGGNNKIYIQSMTNTKTSDVIKTIEQINQLAIAGCDYVRVAVFDYDDANAIKELVRLSPIPLVADIHFNFEFAILAMENGIKKIRINPGNLDDDDKLLKIVNVAKKHNVVIRVGVNSGSLPEWIIKRFGNTAVGMVELAKYYINKLNSLNFDNIIISLKSSDVKVMIDAYTLASQTFNYPLHLGVTESGPELDGAIKSTAGLSPLLLRGIGNTIRVSISDDPVKEIYIAKKILNSLGLYDNLVDIISCPTCGRLQYDMLPLVNQIKEYTKNLNFPLKISILGCVVNGIGEGKEADIGVAGGKGKAILFEDGKIIKNVNENELLNELKNLIDKKYNNFLNKKINK